MNNPNVYTVAQAAEAYSVSDATIRRAIKIGKIEARMLGRKILIPKQSLDEWIQSMPYYGEE